MGGRRSPRRGGAVRTARRQRSEDHPRPAMPFPGWRAEPRRIGVSAVDVIVRWLCHGASRVPGGAGPISQRDVTARRARRRALEATVAADTWRRRRSCKGPSCAMTTLPTIGADVTHTRPPDSDDQRDDSGQPRSGCANAGREVNPLDMDGTGATGRPSLPVAIPSPGIPVTTDEYDRLKEQARTRRQRHDVPAHEDRPPSASDT